MKKLLVIACVMLSSCATTGKDGSSVSSCNDQDRSITKAIKLYEKGNERDAADCLQEIISKGRREGVTDEALFRLSLVHLKRHEKDDLEQSQKRLEELQRDYPSSQWTGMAAPLIAFLKDFQRQNRELKTVNQALIKENKEVNSLRGLNITLIKENKELRQTIEKLKYLDLELENKPRRY